MQVPLLRINGNTNYGIGRIVNTMTNPEVVSAFLRAYQNSNYVEMQTYLHAGVEFSDLAFEAICGDDVRAMWHWFCVSTESRAEPVRVPRFHVDKAEDDWVDAWYEVDYRLGDGQARTRRVNYVIRTHMALQNGKIIRQVDTPTISNLRFALMAVGFPKCLAALTPFFKPKLRQQMSEKLAAFRSAYETKAVERSA